MSTHAEAKLVMPWRVAGTIGREAFDATEPKRRVLGRIDAELFGACCEVGAAPLEAMEVTFATELLQHREVFTEALIGGATAFACGGVEAQRGVRGEALA